MPSFIFFQKIIEKRMNNKYDLALIQKEGDRGLTKEEVIRLFDLLSEEEGFPIEILPSVQECSAMGFISTSAAEKLNYYYGNLNEYICSILEDIQNETENGVYLFEGLSIWMGY